MSPLISLCLRILTLDSLYFILLIIINLVVSLYLTRDVQLNNSELENSLNNEYVQTFGVVGTVCIGIVTIRSILESIDSDEINKYFKNTI